MDIIIRADRKIDNKLLALELLDGEVIIERLLNAAKTAGIKYVSIFTGYSDNERKIGALKNKFHFKFIDSLDNLDRPLILDVSVVYHPGKLLALLASKKNPQKAAIWKIRSLEDLNFAQSMLNKRNFYPLARYYLVPVAKLLAKALEKTRITANFLTIADAFVGSVICLGLLIYNMHFVKILSLIILLWWMLDHADGYLARLKNQQTNFGAFLDSFLGSLLWHMMHLCLSLGLYFKYGRVIYLILGIFYMFGSFMFIFSNYLLAELKDNKSKSNNKKVSVFSKPQGVKRIISYMDDTDVRIHMLAITCFLGLPVISLIYHAIYCNFRWAVNFLYICLKPLKLNR